MRWAADGSKICIIYEDGAVIVGGVDGKPKFCTPYDYCRWIQKACALITSKFVLL